MAANAAYFFAKILTGKGSTYYHKIIFEIKAGEFEMAGINDLITEATENIINEAILNIAEMMPNDEAKEDFLKNLDNNIHQGLNAVITGQDYQYYLNQSAYEASVFLANHYTDMALHSVIKKMPHGKNRETIQNALEVLSHRGIESLCRGTSLDEIKSELAKCAKGQLKNYIASEIQRQVDNISNSLYKNLKFSGKGSRAKNRYIKSGTGILANELGIQFASNIGDVIDGRKNLTTAVTDIAVNTTKNASVTWAKGQGAELAAEAFKGLTKLAEKKIKNELAKNLTITALSKLANANALTQSAGYLIDVGTSLKLLMNGEISKAEFLRTVGEKGTAFVVSSAFTTLGTLIGGPAFGMAIGSSIGYFATNCLFGSVLQAFDKAELSRKRYEMIHEFCEYQINEMKAQRLEFERKVAELLKNRQQVIDTSLNKFEESMKQNDFNSMSAALNDIAVEFGGELQFKTFDEFDEFMSDDNTTLEL